MKSGKTLRVTVVVAIAGAALTILAGWWSSPEKTATGTSSPESLASVEVQSHALPWNGSAPVDDAPGEQPMKSSESRWLFTLLDRARCADDLSAEEKRAYETWRQGLPEYVEERRVTSEADTAAGKPQEVIHQLENVQEAAPEYGFSQYALYKIKGRCSGAPLSEHEVQALDVQVSRMVNMAEGEDRKSFWKGLLEEAVEKFEFCAGYRSTMEDAWSHLEHAVGAGYLPAVLHDATTKRPVAGSYSETVELRRETLRKLEMVARPNMNANLAYIVAKQKYLLAHHQRALVKESMAYFELARRLQPLGFIPGDLYCPYVDEQFALLPTSEKMDIEAMAEAVYLESTVR